MTKKAKKVSVVDKKVSQAVNILLKSALPDINVVKRGLVSMSILDEDRLQKMLNNMPSQADMKAIKFKKEELEKLKDQLKKLRKSELDTALNQFPKFGEQDPSKAASGRSKRKVAVEDYFSKLDKQFG